MSLDVVVCGAGPAGSAVAGLLAARGRSVALLERTPEGPRSAGESFGGELRALLERLGSARLLDEVRAAQVPFRGVRVAWGEGPPSEMPSLARALGEGWHVDRARFDAALRDYAASAGARLVMGAGAARVTRDGDLFAVSAPHAAEVRARCFVDASGRGAPASAGLRAHRWVAVDRQVGVVARTGPSARRDETELLLESVEQGWWYSVPQPDGALVVVLVTDADLEAAGPRAELDARFAAALGAAPLTRERVQSYPALGPARIVRADSGWFAPPSEERWWCVGDAGLALDPLSGQGVASALRAAIAAADDVEAALAGQTRHEDAPWSARLRELLDTRAAYYLRETRFAASTYWARRRPVDWRAERLWLDPEATLVRARDDAPAERLAPIEALLPRVALEELLARLATPRPAHQALASLRQLAPIGDGRLVVALQLLVESGVVARS